MGTFPIREFRNLLHIGHLLRDSGCNRSMPLEHIARCKTCNAAFWQDSVE